MLNIHINIVKTSGRLYGAVDAQCKIIWALLWNHTNCSTYSYHSKLSEDLKGGEYLNHCIYTIYLLNCTCPAAFLLHLCTGRDGVHRTLMTPIKCVQTYIREGMEETVVSPQCALTALALCHKKNLKSSQTGLHRQKKKLQDCLQNMWGKGRFNHNSRKKGLTLIRRFFLVLDSFFFNGWKALIEKEALRKTSVEELVKFKMFKELAWFWNGTVLLSLGVDVCSQEQQGMICYLVVHMPWVSIAPKPTGRNCWKMFWQIWEPLCVQVCLGLFLTE